jgi:hypothetical protein
MSYTKTRDLFVRGNSNIREQYKYLNGHRILHENRNKIIGELNLIKF